MVAGDGRHGVVVWVNGAFGSGKTTLVGELSRRWPRALVYDPEQIGNVLRGIVEVPTDNYQDLPLWRRQTASMALGLSQEYRRPLLVPMTLADAKYAEEIFGALSAGGLAVHHFYLKVSPGELARRIDARSAASAHPDRDEDARWCKKQIARCAATLDALPGDTVFLDGERPTPELADEVLARVRG